MNKGIATRNLHLNNVALMTELIFPPLSPSLEFCLANDTREDLYSPHLIFKLTPCFQWTSISSIAP